MLTDKAGESGAMNLNQMQDSAMNVVEALCSIVSRPIELVFRPWHGTRYFQPPVIAFSTFMVLAIPAIGALFEAGVAMIPFSHPRPAIGLFGFAALVKVYFALSLFHAFRHYRLMIHPENEINSEFEGPPLPFFNLLPKSGSFWFTRIVLEPAFVLVAATILGRIFIFQSGLTIFLQVSALALAMKNWVGWFRAWEFIRTLMDQKFSAPIIAKLADNQATEDELAVVHLASFPKNLDPEIRASAVSHIARTISR